MLFLADVPDQVRVLTLYGKLKMGFRNASGEEVAFVVPDERAGEPDRRPRRPARGRHDLDAATLNGRGFIDVTLRGAGRLPPRRALDHSTPPPDFTITARSAARSSLDPNETPILLNAATHTYRYFLRVGTGRPA